MFKIKGSIYKHEILTNQFKNLKLDQRNWVVNKLEKGSFRGIDA